MKENNDNALKELLAPETDPVVEIAPGMTAEEMRAAYFDKDALREPPYKLYRLNEAGHRYYYRFEDGQPVFYPSVTTLIRKTTPTSPFLIQWMVQNGDAATEKRDMAAAYGTFMHREFERLVIMRTYDLDAAGDSLRQYMEQENIPDKYYYDWLPRIKRDILAFAQFLKDYEVKPLAIEIALVHPRWKFAGAIDFPCEMTWKKKRVIAIIDFKSGRNGFYEDYELQLGLYKMMWDETYPDKECEMIFNFSPKDWRTVPSYNLKNQTDSPNLAKLPHLLALAAIEDEKRENTVTYCDGVVDLDGELADNFHTLSLAELITAKHNNAESTETAK